MKHLLTPLACLLALSPSLQAAGGDEFFEKKVRPLLIERCYECHSAEKKIKGGLRLDTREGWVKGGDSGPAAHPGEPEKSLLMDAVRYANRDMQMPPKQKLPAEEIAILEEWIRSGAPDPRAEAPAAKGHKGMSIEEGRKFWSYAPLQKPHIPPLENDPAATSIDRFLLTRMKSEGISPAPVAAPEVLLRRLFYTLSGLPPSPEQLEAFSKAAEGDREAATARIVDELLASPRFGETWGRHWLDITRFAESSGGGRTLLFKDAWRYRDYVLESINSDVPLSQLILEHIAGDLLPAESPAQRRRQLIATAFLALGPTNYEEQHKQQLRFDIIDEQLETIGRTFMGQTIGCARCHDHKFDPIPQTDYYAMAGIFASTKTLLNYTDNVARWISLPLPADGEEEKALLAHEQKVADLKKQLAEAQALLTEKAKTVGAPTSAPGAGIGATTLPGIVLDDPAAKVVGNWRHSTFSRSFIGTGYLSDENKGKGEKTVTFTPTIPETARYDVRIAYTHQSNRANNVRIIILHADGEDTIYVDQKLPPPIDGRFISLGKFRFEKEGAGYVLISNEGTQGYVVVDALQLLPENEATKTETTSLPSPRPSDKKVQPAKDSEEQLKVRDLEVRLKGLQKEGPVRPTTMAVHDDSQIANTRVRIRGVERQQGAEVPRGFLQVALHGTPPPLPDSESGRKEFAQWMVSKQNPLTARVMANRIWHWLFGAGIVPSVDNFGTTGDQPTHPELLEYLAGRLIEENWSLKKLIREIVLSRAWQAETRPNTQSDPENRLISHANRRRLTAEQIRDSILFISGMIDLKFGGANIAGASEIDANNSSAQNIEYSYEFKDLRRSVYTPAFRNRRLELFEVFDFANVNQPIGQRSNSNVAPQALFLLNSPFIANTSKAAARRTLASFDDDSRRLEDAFRRTLGRGPSAVEKSLCERFLSTAKDAEEAWEQVHHMLFACMDFRYLH